MAEEDRQALGAVKLSLAKNVAYNVVNEKTTYGLLKALSNMYEKPSASNKVFLIRQLVNTKMNEGASIADHVNEFNSILSRLMSVDIKFDDEVQALLLLSSLPESWSGTVTAVSGSTGSTKLKFDNICDLIIGEDIRRKTSGEYSNSLLSAKDKGSGRKQDRGQNQNRSRSKSKKIGQSKNRQDIMDKEVNMATGDYDDALLCCIENTINDHIMDSGALLHATYCKEELERFKLRSGKVRLVDDKTLDIAGVRDVVLKTSFGTSWTLKDVSLVVAHGYKRGSLYMVEVPSDRINAATDGRGNTALWHQRLGHMSEKGMKILALKGRIPDLQKAVVGFCEPCILGKQKKADPATMLPLSMTSAGRMLKTVPETPQQNGVAERMNRTLNERAKSMRLHAWLPKMFWEDPVTMAAYLINRGPSVPLGFRIPEEEWQGKEVSLAHLKVFGCNSYVKVKDVARDKLDAKSVKCTFIGYGSDEMGYRFWDSKSYKKDQVVLEDSLDNLGNKSIVTKHGLSSKITQSSGGSSDASEGSKNSGSFEDSGRSDEEDYKDRASSEEGGSETPQLRRSTRESRAPWKKANYKEIVSLEKNQTWSLVRLPARKKALQSKWVFRGVDYNEIFSPVVKMTTIRLFLSIVAAENLHLEQLDVKTVFLYGDLDEDIYMTQPEGFQSAGKEENLVCKLKKSLYGLKQALRQWLRHGRNQEAQETVVLRIRDEGFSKKQAPKTEASRRRMARVPYASGVGSMMYTMVCTRPNIAHAMGVVSRFMSNPGREHWEAVKWLLRYLKGTLKATLCFGRKEVVLEGFSDSDYREVYRYVNYRSREACKELVWLKNILEELDRAQTECVLFCDNQSAIHLTKNLVFHGRTKHIKIRYHYIRELVSEGTLSLKKILGAKNPADMLTKVVTTEKLKLCAASTGLRDN
ncbi:retrovirus-related pol polyprotein from transposon TNT 1-94 [Tanacetum coccineum]|uniref:Retrovirus-related pol polyprotein from transposon TNT 1-94 n=1 Tax=Tanacetum coccineum TaxID=301880 RepID=A0ABQ5DXT5_9ASTR